MGGRKCLHRTFRLLYRMEDYFFLVLVWLFVLASLLASVLPVLMMVRLVLVFRRPEKLSVAFFHPYWYATHKVYGLI